jgi:hypothetical protein
VLGAAAIPEHTRGLAAALLAALIVWLLVTQPR